jgi:hypothetical protein
MLFVRRAVKRQAFKSQGQGHDTHKSQLCLGIYLLITCYAAQRCPTSLPSTMATLKFWKLKKINQRSFSPFFYSVEKLSSFVGESVILSFYACLVNKRPRISSQPRHCTADVSIQLHNLLDTARVKKRRCNPLLYYKHDTFSSLYSDGGRSKLDNDKNRTFGKYFSVISEQERRAST